jgi:F0F1-type ATP synthase gamma subunit
VRRYNSQPAVRAQEGADALLADPGKQVKFFVYGRKAYRLAQKRRLRGRALLRRAAARQGSTSPPAKLVGQALVDAFTPASSTRCASLHALPVDDQVRADHAPFLPIRSIAGGEQAAAKEGERRRDARAGRRRLVFKLMPRYLETACSTRCSVADLRARQSPHGDEERHRRRHRMQGPEEGLQPQASENITKELLDIVGGASAVSCAAVNRPGADARLQQTRPFQNRIPPRTMT